MPDEERTKKNNNEFILPQVFRMFAPLIEWTMTTADRLEDRSMDRGEKGKERERERERGEENDKARSINVPDRLVSRHRPTDKYLFERV